MFCELRQMVSQVDSFSESNTAEMNRGEDKETSIELIVMDTLNRNVLWNASRKACVIDI